MDLGVRCLGLFGLLEGGNAWREKLMLKSNVQVTNVGKTNNDYSPL